MKITCFCLILVLITGFMGNGYSELAECQAKNKPENPSILREDREQEMEALNKEKIKSDIDYAIANVNRPFGDTDRARFPAWGSSVGYFTYGLIGGLYAGYGDRKKSAEYYYKDYLQAMECSRKQREESERSKKPRGPTPQECWGGTPEGGLLNQLQKIIAMYEMDQDYKGALPYYRMELEDYDLKDVPGDTFELKIYALRERARNEERVKELQELGWTTEVEVIDGWEKARKLAKTTKPKPLDPAVQHHEWFYSDKRSEVMKALAYYHKHEVRFMLEKALGHKDPKVAAKAKKYLESLGKDNGPGK